MPDILIRAISPETEALLRRRALRHGKSLEAELRDALETLARDEDAQRSEDEEPFGSWLVSISRPGFDLDGALALLRSAPVRPIDLD